MPCLLKRDIIYDLFAGCVFVGGSWYDVGGNGTFIISNKLRIEYTMCVCVYVPAYVNASGHIFYTRTKCLNHLTLQITLGNFLHLKRKYRAYAVQYIPSEITVRTLGTCTHLKIHLVPSAEWRSNFQYFCFYSDSSHG